MPLFYCTVAMMAVTVIYLFWRSYLQARHVRNKMLRERLARMLWVMADVSEDEDSLIPTGRLDEARNAN